MKQSFESPANLRGRMSALCLAVLASFALAACGGGSDDNPNPVNPNPDGGGSTHNPSTGGDGAGNNGGAGHGGDCAPNTDCLEPPRYVKDLSTPPAIERPDIPPYFVDSQTLKVPNGFTVYVREYSKGAATREVYDYKEVPHKNEGETIKLSSDVPKGRFDEQGEFLGIDVFGTAIVVKGEGRDYRLTSNWHNTVQPHSTLWSGEYFLSPQQKEGEPELYPAYMPWGQFKTQFDYQHFAKAGATMDSLKKEGGILVYKGKIETVSNRSRRISGSIPVRIELLNDFTYTVDTAKGTGVGQATANPRFDLMTDSGKGYPGSPKFPLEDLRKITLQKANLAEIGGPRCEGGDKCVGVKAGGARIEGAGKTLNGSYELLIGGPKGEEIVGRILIGSKAVAGFTGKR